MTLSTIAIKNIDNIMRDWMSNGIESAQPFFRSVCYEVPSVKASNEYGMLGNVPGVQEWKGEREFATLAAATWRIENRDWATGIKIPKKSYDDDTYGLYQQPIAEVGSEFECHKDELFIEMLEAADATNGFDDVPFYSTSHLWGKSGTQSNKITYTCVDASNPTAAELKGAFHAARAQMLSLKRQNGKKYVRAVATLNQNLIMQIHPDLELNARTGLDATITTYAAPNIVLNRPQIIPHNGLTSATRFWVHNMGQALKPFIWQPRSQRRPWIKGWEDPEEKDVKVGVDGRYNFGFWAPWLSIQVTLVD